MVDRGRTGWPHIVIPHDARPLPIGTDDRWSLLKDLDLIERKTGARFDLPTEIDADEARHIAGVAQRLRKQSRSVAWRDIKLTIADDAIEPMRKGGAIRIERTISTRVLGVEIELGRQRTEVKDFVVHDVRPADGVQGESWVELRPREPGIALTEVLLVTGLSPSTRPAKKRATVRSARPGR